jgi:xanthine dehydrogenase YagT iron-sulfur-binding subunit
MPGPSQLDLSRRDVLLAAAATTAMTSIPLAARADTSESEKPVLEKVTLTVNGKEEALELDPRTTLLDALREHLHLTGTKKGCDQGACGACTILADGERINACLALAVQYDGVEITTIEAMAAHPVGSAAQEAFVPHEAFQCGFCTAGQICSTVALLAELERGDVSAATTNLAADAVPLTDAEIKERMSGNLCRCGAYAGIVAAIRDVYMQKVQQ